MYDLYHKQFNIFKAPYICSNINSKEILCLASTVDSCKSPLGNCVHEGV